MARSQVLMNVFKINTDSGTASTFGTKYKGTLKLHSDSKVDVAAISMENFTYSYQSEGRINSDNYYFPMAGTNVMFGVNIEL